jgi:hypothetical protein
MTTLTTKTEAVPDEMTGLGGRGLTSTIVANEISPTHEPLGKKTGILTIGPAVTTADPENFKIQAHILANGFSITPSQARACLPTAPVPSEGPTVCPESRSSKTKRYRHTTRVRSRGLVSPMPPPPWAQTIPPATPLWPISLRSEVFSNLFRKERQVELSRNLQIATAVLDSTGLCFFVAFPVLDMPETFSAIYGMINARYGLNITAADVAELGKSILKTEHEFNLAAGFTSKDDRLPEFFEEEIPPHNAVWDMSDAEIDTFWNF